MTDIQQDAIQQWDLTIDRNGELPIGVQLAWALRARIGDGRLAAGQRLPGLRELAEMLGINANTARAVYQRLEHEGLIDSRQGTGTFVASSTPEPSAVSQIAAQAAREARETGVDPREVAAVLYVTAEPPSDPFAASAERRRELRTQIAALEQALSELQWEHPELISASHGSPARRGEPRLLGVEDLQQIRTQLVRRLADAEASPGAVDPEPPSPPTAVTKTAKSTVRKAALPRARPSTA